MRLRHSTGRKRKRRERCCEKVSRGVVGEASEAEEEEEEGGGEVTGEVMRYYWCNFLVKEDERKRKSVNMLGLMGWWIHA